jgi:hypothetical protein
MSNGYGDNALSSFKEWELLYIYWLPNTYKDEVEFVVLILTLAFNT